jgi:carbonic anhydrase
MVHGSEDEDEADAHAVISIFFDRKLGGNEHNRFI